MGALKAMILLIYVDIETATTAMTLRSPSNTVCDVYDALLQTIYQYAAYSISPVRSMVSCPLPNIANDKLACVNSLSLYFLL